MLQNAKTVICNMSDKLKINFLYVGLHTDRIGTNLNKPCISDGFSVIFVEQPNKRNLDWCEDRWFSKLDAKININKVILPKIKQFDFLPFAMFELIQLNISFSIYYSSDQQ